MIQKILMAMFVAVLSTACGAAGRDAEFAQMQKQYREAMMQNDALRKEIVARTDAQQHKPAANNPPAPPAPAQAKTDGQLKPLLMPAVVSDIPRVDGIAIIGFDESLDPCTDNAYERSLVTSYGSPLINLRLLLARKLTGRCMAVRRSAYWIHVHVDNVEMHARYIGDMGRSIPMSYCTVRDGKVRNLPLTPPGQVTRWLMPRGGHTVSYDLYEPAPTGECYEYVKTIKKRLTFPFQQDPWGAVDSTPEAYLLP